MEQAARSLGASEATIFRRIVLPNILPGILSGVALAFARAVGEIGSLVIISGSLPYKTEVASVYILSRVESGDRAGAAAIAVVLLVSSFLVILGIGVVRRLDDPPRRGAGTGMRTETLGSADATPRTALDRARSTSSRSWSGPLAMVFWRTFENGYDAAWSALTTPETLQAFKLTLLITAIAVPLNTVFGVVCALAIVRRDFPGKGLLNAFVDLPLALSPVVVGLSLFLLYGREGWFGGWLEEHDIQVLFALPAMVLATVFVSLPFVCREVVPTLREIGDEQEQAARTLGASGWQTLRRITLPAIRWAIVYGVVLTTARCLGEYGAVAVVSGRIQGQTETATLRVEERYDSFDVQGAYAISLVLALLAVLVLIAMTVFQRKEETA